MARPVPAVLRVALMSGGGEMELVILMGALLAMIMIGAPIAVTMAVLPAIYVAVTDELLKPAIGAISAGAKTGKIGDGKIFVLPLEDVLRIRTDEHGDSAV